MGYDLCLLSLRGIHKGLFDIIKDRKEDRDSIIPNYRLSLKVQLQAALSRV